MAELRRRLARLLPTWLSSWLVDFRATERGYRMIFLRLQFRRLFDGDRPLDLSGVQSIVFVCHGNILRSPMAEELLRKRLQIEGVDDVHIASAGVHASVGSPADDRGCVSAKDFGVSLYSHRSRLLTADIVAEADAVVVMDRRNETTVIGRFPTAANKLVLLGSFFPRSARRSVFIADPYSGTLEDVKRCYRTIAIAIDEVVRRICNERRSASVSALPPKAPSGARGHRSLG
jgi:protein-tyrosine-phosphatase